MPPVQDFELEATCNPPLSGGAIWLKRTWAEATHRKRRGGPQENRLPSPATNPAGKDRARNCGGSGAGSRATPGYSNTRLERTSFWLLRHQGQRDVRARRDTKADERSSITGRILHFDLVARVRVEAGAAVYTVEFQADLLAIHVEYDKVMRA
jgi:hypothetical protein